MQVAERGQPLADGAHSLASRACSWGKTYPLVFYKYGVSPVDFIIQFQSKILREKRRERERVPAKRSAGKGPVVVVLCLRQGEWFRREEAVWL